MVQYTSTSWIFIGVVIYFFSKDIHLIFNVKNHKISFLINTLMLTKCFAKVYYFVNLGSIDHEFISNK